jgi:hypothetical protein
MRASRWSDNDQHLGPITYGTSDYKTWGVMLTSSGHGEDDDGACELRINLRSWYLIIALPNILRPHKTKVYPKWDRETVERLGRDYYWDVDARSYGFSLGGCGDIGNSSFLQVHYGRQGGSAMDSAIEQRWSCFLPWTQWRHVRHSFYGLEGELIHHEPTEPMGRLGDAEWRKRWDEKQSREAAVPTMSFIFEDFDGERLVARTRIEEREWRFGTGWFKWLSLFRRPKIQRSLDIAFSGETGKRKGSWKGGTVGHSIEMRHDDTHFQAFSRYCREHDMKFIGLET